MKKKVLATVLTGLGGIALALAPKIPDFIKTRREHDNAAKCQQIAKARCDHWVECGNGSKAECVQKFGYCLPNISRGYNDVSVDSCLLELKQRSCTKTGSLRCLTPSAVVFD